MAVRRLARGEAEAAYHRIFYGMHILWYAAKPHTIEYAAKPHTIEYAYILKPHTIWYAYAEAIRIGMRPKPHTIEDVSTCTNQIHIYSLFIRNGLVCLASERLSGMVRIVPARRPMSALDRAGAGQHTRAHTHMRPRPHFSAQKGKRLVRAACLWQCQWPRQRRARPGPDERGRPQVEGSATGRSRAARTATRTP